MKAFLSSFITVSLPNQTDASYVSNNNNIIQYRLTYCSFSTMSQQYFLLRSGVCHLSMNQLYWCNILSLSSVFRHLLSSISCTPDCIWNLFFNVQRHFDALIRWWCSDQSLKLCYQGKRNSRSSQSQVRVICQSCHYIPLFSRGKLIKMEHIKKRILEHTRAWSKYLTRLFQLGPCHIS